MMLPACEFDLKLDHQVDSVVHKPGGVVERFLSIQVVVSHQQLDVGMLLGCALQAAPDLLCEDNALSKVGEPDAIDALCRGRDSDREGLFRCLPHHGDRTGTCLAQGLELIGSDAVVNHQMVDLFEVGEAIGVDPVEFAMVHQGDDLPAQLDHLRLERPFVDVELHQALFHG